MSSTRWDYDNPYYYEAVDHLMHLQQDGKILHLGLTNFDSEHMVDLIEQGAPIVSNQVRPKSVVYIHQGITIDG